MTRFNKQLSADKIADIQWRSIFTLGAISTIIALIGIVIDLVIGVTLGGNLSDLPQTAVARFEQFNVNSLLGLYNLDLLNILIQLLLIPGYFALYTAHRNINQAFSFLAFIIFIVGTTIFVTQNTALPMFELSHKYFATDIESQRNLYAAAGEGMLAKGEHGSAGVFLGFLIPNIAGLIISLVMLKGKVFNRTTAMLGIIGSVLILVYVILVTFVPGVKNMATFFAMPGGLLLMGWMIMFAKRLFILGRS